MRYPIHHGRPASLFLAALAVAMLIVAGGPFAHAGALRTGAADCHGTPVLGAIGESGHAGDAAPLDCDTASKYGQLHCGAGIVLASSAKPATFVSIPIARQPRPGALPAGRIGAVEPPPPRPFFQTV